MGELTRREILLATLAAGLAPEVPDCPTATAAKVATETFGSVSIVVAVTGSMPLAIRMLDSYKANWKG